MLTLFSYNICPYAAKVRAVLCDNKLPFGERFVHPPLQAEVEALSRHSMVATVEDNRHVMVDSTGPSPTVVDFAAFGWFSRLDGLDRRDLLEARPGLAHLLRSPSEPAEHTASPSDEQSRQLLAGGSNGTPASRPAPRAAPPEHLSTEARQPIALLGTTRRHPRLCRFRSFRGHDDTLR
jgi:hypothetical protein